MTITSRIRPNRVLAASAALAAGVVTVVSAVVPGSQGIGLLGLDRGSPTTFEHTLGIVGGLALLIVARGLWRGTRSAALIGAAVLATAAAIGIGYGQLIAPGVELAGAAVLVADRAAFSRGSSRRGTRLPAAVAGVAVAGAWLTAALGLLIADRVRGLGGAAGTAGGWLLDGGWWLRSGTPAAILMDLLVLAAIGAGGVLLRGLLRPVIAHEGHTAMEHERAAAIVAGHAADSLDPFTLREDKAFHFARGGFLAYRTLRGTAVVSGDPVGPDGVAPAILESFAAEARRRGWDVVMTGASGRHLTGYRALGFKTVCIGEEAVVDPAGFSLEGGQMRSVRKAIGRQRRRGWKVEVLTGDELGADVVTELGAVDREWRAGQPRLTGFAMTLGRLWGAAEDSRSLYAVGRDPEGVIKAFVRFARYRDGLSLDVMRRVGESPNGLTEALVAAAIEHTRDAGLPAVSLNFAGFAHVMGADQPLTRRLRCMRWLLTRYHDRFQLERLVTFNKKFAPRWDRRYLVHQGSLDLPVAGLRVLQAEAYLRAPREQRLSARWEPGALPVPAASRQALPAR